MLIEPDGVSVAGDCRVLAADVVLALGIVRHVAPRPPSLGRA